MSIGKRKVYLTSQAAEFLQGYIGQDNVAFGIALGTIRFVAVESGVFLFKDDFFGFLQF